tara:strand:+ start:387 stop:620 length:234 start_codon:yes stop_codon:yes gene_type:complete
MNGYVSNVTLETLNTNDTYTIAKPQMITEFQLVLGDGSTVTVPCTEISRMEGTAVLAAALHHLIQRVAALEALEADQ